MVMVLRFLSLALALQTFRQLLRLALSRRIGLLAALQLVPINLFWKILSALLPLLVQAERRLQAQRRWEQAIRDVRVNGVDVFTFSVNYNVEQYA
jgi:hypothetical protein